MPARYELTFFDYDGKSANAGVWGVDLTAGNITAQIAAAQAFRDAVIAVSLGAMRKEQLLAYVTKSATALPTDPFAQRGTRWLVRMVEAVSGNPVTFKIPAANLALLVAGGENMDITAGAGLALVTAANAYVRSNDGNAATVSEVVYED